MVPVVASGTTLKTASIQEPPARAGWSDRQLRRVLGVLWHERGGPCPSPADVSGVELNRLSFTSVPVFSVRIILSDGVTLLGYAKAASVELEWQAHRRAAAIGRAATARRVSLRTAAHGGGQPFYLMPLEGISLYESALKGELSEAIAEDAGRALAQLHAVGVVHTDLRRDHCFVRRCKEGQGEVFFIDFSHAFLGARGGLPSDPEQRGKLNDVNNLRRNIREWGVDQRARSREAPAPFELTEAFDRGLASNLNPSATSAHAPHALPASEVSSPRNAQRALYDLAVKAQGFLERGELDRAWSVLKSTVAQRRGRGALSPDLAEQLGDLSTRMVALRSARRYPGSVRTAVSVLRALDVSQFDLCGSTVFGCWRSGEYTLVDVGVINHLQKRDTFRNTTFMLWKRDAKGFRLVAAARGIFEPEPRAFELRSVVYQGDRDAAMSDLLRALFDLQHVAIWFDDRKFPGGAQERNSWYRKAGENGFLLKQCGDQLEIARAQHEGSAPDPSAAQRPAVTPASPLSGDEAAPARRRDLLA